MRHDMIRQFAGSVVAGLSCAQLACAATGDLLHTLISDNIEGDDAFGISLAVHGNIAVIGAPFNNALGNNSGSAYLFDISTGEQLFELLPDDGVAHDHFGGIDSDGVAINDSIAIVTSGHDHSEDVFNVVYVFDIRTGEQITQLLPPVSEQGGSFGSSVSLDGHMAII